MKTMRLVLAALGCLCFVTTDLHAQTPPLLNYQGRVVVGTTNFDSPPNGQFKFALVLGAGPTLLWKNDGSPGNTEPAAAVSLPVTKGLYSVLLGDSSLGATMTAIPASVFANPDLRLRVWFDDGTINGSQLLTPDQRIAPSAYLADGAVTAAKIAGNAVGPTHIAAGAVGGTQLAPGAVQIGNIAIGAVGSAQIAPGAIGSTQLDPSVGLWTASGDNIFRSGGNVGIGTTDPLNRFVVKSPGPNAISSIVESSSGGRNIFEIKEAAGNGELGLRDASGSARVALSAAGGSFFETGNFGIGTREPGERLHVDGNIFSGAAVPASLNGNADDLVVSRLTGNAGIMIHTPDAAPRSGFLAWSDDIAGNIIAGLIQYDHAANRMSFRTNSVDDQLVIDASGNVGIGTATPVNQFTIRSRAPSSISSVVERSTADGNIFEVKENPNGDGEVAIRNSTGAKIVFLASDTDHSGVIAVRDYNGTYRAVISGREESPTYFNGVNVGIGTANPSETLEVAGNVKISGAGNMLITPKLAITGGADIAEPFDTKGGHIPEGSVMVIDEAHPGQLKISDQPYDTRVAGIVSGAGGVNPGLTLSQQGVMEGRHQVALVGRVYARADATAHPIRPGDLLTTSPMSGHLMRANDRDRAQGAILGKAMTSLESGTGLVLVLVTLQ